nr:hypothetical protein [Rhizobium leguminosarum]
MLRSSPGFVGRDGRLALDDGLPLFFHQALAAAMAPPSSPTAGG